MADSHQGASYSDRLASASGLRHWLIWLGGMLATMMVFGFAATAGDVELVEYGMYGVMVVLAGTLIYKGYVDALFLDRETRLASEQVRILEEVDDMPSFFAAAPASLFRIHLENLYSIARIQPDVTQDNLISLLHDRLMAKNRMIELFASILITLGLVGTIVGLILMMGSLAGVLGSVGPESDLLTQIGDPQTGPLKGLATAFNTTLLGAVLGGVVLRVLTNVIDTNATSYIAHVAELTEVHVLPYLRSVAGPNSEVSS